MVEAPGRRTLENGTHPVSACDVVAISDVLYAEAPAYRLALIYCPALQQRDFRLLWRPFLASIVQRDFRLLHPRERAGCTTAVGTVLTDVCLCPSLASTNVWEDFSFRALHSYHTAGIFPHHGAHTHHVYSSGQIRQLQGFTPAGRSMPFKKDKSTT